MQAYETETECKSGYCTQRRSEVTRGRIDAGSQSGTAQHKQQGQHIHYQGTAQDDRLRNGNAHLVIHLAFSGGKTTG